MNFFNFDNDERANIVFAVHPPTGASKQLLRRDNVLVSDDPAGGGAPDPDKTFAFSASQLGLVGYPAARQGYHVKLTVERIGAPGAGKHKVFWIEPCQPASHETSPAVDTTAGAQPLNGGAGGSLPLTGPSVAGMAVLGGTLIAAGATLWVLRRRRRITWVS